MYSIIYLLNTGAILATLTLFYWLFLRRETFYLANRWVLLGAMAVALVIPSLSPPPLVSKLKVDLAKSFEPKQIIKKILSKKKEDSSIANTPAILDGIPFDEIRNQPIQIESHSPPITLWDISKWIYLMGVAIMLIRFLIQLFGVYQQLKNSTITKNAGYYLATSNKDISPFSFWKYIVVNPNKYNEESFLHILEHERIHITQRHTIDMVFAELFLIVQWFNPLAWWHRHLLNQNLEFLVDQTILENGENKKTYQYHLVQVAVPNIPLSISSNYNYSQLKNRIKMMNLQRSSLAVSWKYTLLLPISFLLLMGFTDKIAKEELTTNHLNGLQDIYLILTENTTLEEIESKQKELLSYGIDLEIQDIQFDDHKDQITKLAINIAAGGYSNSCTWNSNKEGYGGYNYLLLNYSPNKYLRTSVNPKVTPFWEDIMMSSEKVQTIFIGIKNTDEPIAFLRNQSKLNGQIFLEQKKHDSNWKGYPTSDSYTSTDLTQKEIDDLKTTFAYHKYKRVIFKINGMKADSTALDIPVSRISAIQWTDRSYAKYNDAGTLRLKGISLQEMNIITKEIRKDIEGKDDQLDEIYVILSGEAKVEEIIAMNSQLKTYGLELIVHDLQYNIEKKIENIDIEFKVENESGVRTRAVGGIEYVVFFRDMANNKIDSGTNPEMLIEARKQQQKKKSKLFIIGNNKENKLNTKTIIEQQIPKNAKEIIIIITEETSIEEIKEAQEALLKYGIRLDIQNIQFNYEQDKITSLTAKMEAGGNSGTCTWQDDSEGYNYMVFYFNPNSGATHNGSNVEIKPIPDDAKLFILGRDNTKESIIFLRNQSSLKTKKILEQNKLNNQNPNWKGYPQSASHTEIDLTPKRIAELKERIKQVNPTQIIYKVDGIEWEENALDIPVDKIQYIKWSKWSHVKMDDTGQEKSSSTEKLELSIVRKTTSPHPEEKLVSLNENKSLDSTGFIHEPDAIHYLISPCTEADFEQTRIFFKEMLFKLGGKHRYSSLNSGPYRNLFIVRKFDNYKEAVKVGNILAGSTKPMKMKLYPISQANYRQVLKHSSLAAYKTFYENFNDKKINQ